MSVMVFLKFKIISSLYRASFTPLFVLQKALNKKLNRTLNKLYNMSIQRKAPLILAGGLELAGLGKPDFWSVAVEAIQLKVRSTGKSFLLQAPLLARLGTIGVT